MARQVHQRKDHGRSTLSEDDAGDDPIVFFHRWLDEALDAGLPEPNAMALATAGVDGVSCRIVLLRAYDEHGFVFYSNYNSRKAMQFEHDARVALTFFWPELERQVRIEGRTSRITAEGSEAYFRTRPRASQVGAWASDQSAGISDRAALDKKYASWEERFQGKEVPRPAHWGGVRVTPARIEFWQGRSDRMHDRLLYVKESSGAWSRTRLQP